MFKENNYNRTQFKNLNQSYLVISIWTPKGDLVLSSSPATILLMAVSAMLSTKFVIFLHWLMALTWVNFNALFRNIVSSSSGMSASPSLIKFRIILRKSGYLRLLARRKNSPFMVSI